MKRTYIYIITGVLCFSFFSCDDKLDVNTDPLAASSANPNAVLPFVFAEYSARKMSELGTRISDVSHHLGHTFNSPKNGTTSIFLTGNTWGTWYVGLLGNLVLLEADAAEAGTTSNNVQAVAKIMKSQLFFELTSLWGAVPYTEALDGVNFPEPNFDSQEVVLDGVVSELDAAMALIDAMPASGNFDFSSGDLLLGGDMTAWRELANSIKIRTLMLIRNVASRESGAESQLVTAFGQPTVSEPVFFGYDGGSGADNAYFGIVNAFFGPSNEATQIFGPSQTTVDLLRGNNDPRVDLWLVDLSGTGDYPTATYGRFPGAEETVLADNIIRGDLPDVYFLPSEIEFYRAELLLDGVAVGGGTAQAAFETAVSSTVQYWGGGIEGFQGNAVSAAAADAFAASLGTVDLTKVHEQLWLETFLRPVVAWNHVRRTNTPALQPSGAATIPTILKRFDYPPNEVAANPNTPANPPTETPMWFEN
ncbi:MAG: SusD/RagB family nutrient-binding outer membrane lipoprotein [Cyclobacteriaceae bacterium]